MTDLLSRLSAATAPSRELDEEIALANGWTFQKLTSGETRGPDAHPYWRKPGVTEWYKRETGGPPRYTESIDAAMTMVPKGMYWLIGAGITRPDEPLYGAQLLRPDARTIMSGPEVIAEGESHATPAIALVIACLKARKDSKP